MILALNAGNSSRPSGQAWLALILSVATGSATRRVMSRPADVFEIAEMNNGVLTCIVLYRSLFEELTVERAQRELERRGVTRTTM